jgi:hypothetical protein
MTKRVFNAAACAAAIAIASLTMGTSTIAATVECTGPLKQCAIEVGAFCEMENGKMMLWYKDREGASRRFEECVGRVYEANGKPNPYRPATAQKPAPKR